MDWKQGIGCLSIRGLRAAASHVLWLILWIGNREYDARVLRVERGGPEREGFWLLNKVEGNSGVHIQSCLSWTSSVQDKFAVSGAKV